MATLSLLAWPARTVAALDFGEFVRAQIDAAEIPGLALGIAGEGQVISTYTYGFADLTEMRPVTGDTIFHIASITKTVTAMTVAKLADENGISLDQPIAPYLDFDMPGAEAMSFRHLLMHTSGISDETYYAIDFRTPGRDSPMPIGELVRAYLTPGGRYAATSNVKRTPGAQWEYSNIGYALLGYLAGRIAGRDMREYTHDALFEPLGLRHIGWTLAEAPVPLRATPYDVTDDGRVAVQPVGFPDWSAGMLRASIGDLTKLVSAAANGGATDDLRLLTTEANAGMLTMQRPAGLPDWLTGQGLGWQESLLAGKPRINHWGGDPGVFTMAYLDPGSRSAVVLLSNLSATTKSRDAMRAIAARALLMASSQG